MALMIKRATTIYSLAQLAEPDAELAPQGAAAPPLAPAKGFLSAPECPVKDIKGALLPLYRLPVGDRHPAAKQRRVRSFGDLHTVPDISDPRLRPVDDCSPAYSSEDEFSSASSDADGASAGALQQPQLQQVVPQAGGAGDGGVGAGAGWQRSALDLLLLAEWEDRSDQGLFRYDVTACPTKVLPGAYGFIALFNEGRASKKRPTEFRMDQVSQPFDASKFHFGKALQKEALLQLESTRGARSSYAAAAPAPASPHLVLINVSPIEYGHILLVPRVNDCLPQLIAADTLHLALHFTREAGNPYFRVTYNSLGAYGTINHLHFQAYYLEAPFAIERAPTAPLDLAARPGACAKKCAWRGRGVSVHQVLEYPVKALVFEAGDSLWELAEVVAAACERLAAANVPHNLLLADCGGRVFIFPNCFAERKAKGEIPEEVLDMQVDPAGWEIAGHILLKREVDYAAATQEAAWRLLSYASFCEARFREVAAIALGLEGER